MRTIYIDPEFKCHVTQSEGMTAVETDFFDGKCSAFVEGYCLVPEGATWKREDGEVFPGVMVFPWRDYRLLVELQAVYEQGQNNA